MNLYSFTLIASISLSICSVFSIDKTNNFIIDTRGLYRIFHGVNVVYKLSPFLPDTETFNPFDSFTVKDIQILKDLGINMVRFGIIWESIEKEESKYDYDHLGKISSIVDQLAANNITVIIDTHQDMFSRRFCGEGVPSFYVDQLSYETQCKSNILSRVFKLLTACKPLKNHKWRYDDSGMPLLSDCKEKGTFIHYHMAPELSTIYNSFYLNQNGVLDKFAKFWGVIAKEFSNKKNVIGYDVWNEPWANNLWSDIRSLYPGYVDNNHLIPMYQKIDKAIRQVDKDYILMFQPVPFPDTFALLGGMILSTYKKAPIDSGGQMFNVHSYCCMAGPTICSNGEPELKDAKGTCANFHKRKIKKNKKQANDMGVPLIITEFGACSESEACYEEMMGVIRAADKNMVSWAYWNFKPYHDHTTTANSTTEGIFNSNGTIQFYKAKALSRSYIQEYQGLPVSFEYNDDTHEARGEFILNSTIKAPSLLYINRELNYPKGYSLVFREDGNVKINDYYIEEVSKNYINIFIDEKYHGKKIKMELFAL